MVRPETIRDRKTKAVLKVLSARERGALLLDRLHILGQAAASSASWRATSSSRASASRRRAGAAAQTLTHVIHCAASVSFDDTYENSFRANVLGCRNALAFSLRHPGAPGSQFVSHVAIETSYIHGRRKRSIAQENALQFPAPLLQQLLRAHEGDGLDRDRPRPGASDGLRVTQLLPSIVIGHSRTGNNRGDTKVVNAPINAFGRAKEALDPRRQRPRPAARASWRAARHQLPGRPLGGAQPRARRPGGGRHPGRAHGAGGDRRTHPPRHRQPDPLGGDRADHPGGARRQRAPRRPHPSRNVTLPW